MSTKNPLVAAAVVAGVLMVPALASAQAGDVSTGTLTVTATVQSSIALTFESDAAGVPLTGAGTNAATLAFGNITAHETDATPNVTKTKTATDFTVSSPFGVKVEKANSTSANYTLEARLGTADSVNTWKIGALTLDGTDRQVGTTHAYGSAVSHTLALTVPATANAGVISNTVEFTATSN